MNFLTLRIALRYLVSKKTTNAINIITAVAMTGMAAGSLALIIVLSVFNGFEGLVISLYQSFNPDIRITVQEGKVFDINEEQLQKLESIGGVAHLSKVLEENAILRYEDNEYIAILKGVDNHFLSVSDVKKSMIAGQFVLADEDRSFAVLGAGVGSALGVNVENTFNAISIYVPKRGKETMALDPTKAFVRKNILPSGVFSIQQEFDNKYLFVPLDFARSLLKYDNELSALEIKLKPETDVREAKLAMQQILGDNFEIKDRYEQNAFLYKIMRSEKWAVYAILSFILIIAAFNIIGSLSMLVIEKTKDIAILKAMGATNAMIRRIFLLEGMLTSLIGSFAGVLLAAIICHIQITFGVIKLQGSGTFVIEAYPVEMQLLDFVLVMLTVILISAATSWMPAHRAASQGVLIVQE